MFIVFKKGNYMKYISKEVYGYNYLIIIYL